MLWLRQAAHAGDKLAKKRVAELAAGVAPNPMDSPADWPRMSAATAGHSKVVGVLALRVGASALPTKVPSDAAFGYAAIEAR
jgi:hypothetical protein